VVADRDDLIERYLRAIDHELAGLDRPAIHTIFVGGGTPTHLDLRSLERLLDTLDSRLAIQPGAEWSVEANPEDVTDEKLALLAARGVNRISLGVQSFDADKLAQLERGHSGQAAAQAIEQAAERMASVSLDLIFAAPGESIAVWQRDLATALSLPITHLSTYTLTFEKGTAFWTRRLRGELSAQPESAEIEMYQLAREMAAAAGLGQYEISSFAKPGFRCQHNMAYWLGEPWHAVGPGAARFVSGVRETNHRSTTTYLKRIESGQSPVAEVETIMRDEYVRERAAFGVRLIDGIDLDAISTAAGIDARQICGDAIRENHDEGLIDVGERRIRLTERGILFADLVASRFLG
jgi:oxygen-independent coproporphyrinogen-3 oxidase